MKRAILTTIVILGGVALCSLGAQSLYGQTSGRPRTPRSVPTNWGTVTPPAPTPNFRTPYIPK